MLGVQYIDLFECTLTTWNYRFGEGVSLLAHRQRFDSWTAFFAQHSVYEDVFLALVQPRYRTICKASKSNIYIYIYLFIWVKNLGSCEVLVLEDYIYIYVYIYICIYIYTYIYIYIFAVLASHARIYQACNRQTRCKLGNTSPNQDQLGAACIYKNIYCGLAEKCQERQQ